MGMTEAQIARKKNRDSLRDLLAKQGHFQHIFDLTEKLANLDEELDALQIQRLKAVIDTKMRLMNKYLPDLKSVELEGTIDTGITVTINRKRFDGSDD